MYIYTGAEDSHLIVASKHVEFIDKAWSRVRSGSCSGMHI